jgi:hypothetical protein
MTTEEFISKSKEIHGDIYDYSDTIYINNRTKVKIICPSHGLIEQYPQNHFKHKCKKCTTELSKNGIKKFIEKAKEIHGDKYDYSLIDEYKSNKTKLKIICPIHGVFEQDYKSHINKKYGCSKCSGICKKTTIEFINDAKKIHNDKYDYSLVEYKNTKHKIKIICKLHGVFEQKPEKHLLGRGCHICGGANRLTTEEFIDKAKEIHGDKYDYSLVNYINTNTKVKIICKEHGIFEQTPNSHLNGCNCRFCKKVCCKDEQHLYILFDKLYNIFKIGVSNDVERRCRELNSKYYGINKNIEIVKFFELQGKLENKIHKKFEEYNVYHPTYLKNERCDGRSEWFNFDVNECIKYIEHE